MLEGEKIESLGIGELRLEDLSDEIKSEFLEAGVAQLREDARKEINELVATYELSEHAAETVINDFMDGVSSGALNRAAPVWSITKRWQCGIIRLMASWDAADDQILYVHVVESPLTRRCTPLHDVRKGDLMSPQDRCPPYLAIPIEWYHNPPENIPCRNSK